MHNTSIYKKKIRLGQKVPAMQHYLASCGLNTVCESARCPNKAECFSRGTATFMILGTVCTRNCRFCAVQSGPAQHVDSDETERIARAVAETGLTHVVITSVTRDDLPDGGAGHFARTIHAIRNTVPSVSIEVLIPDFKGSGKALLTVLDAKPEVLNHNLETVDSLYSRVRPGADYRQSLELLASARSYNQDSTIKSGFMVGLGETTGQISELMEDLRNAGCDIVTIGQYFQPTKECLPVERSYSDEEFAGLEDQARQLGFKAVAAGRFVRSSYNAQVVLEQARS